jgi:hypothetical protein
VSELKEGDKVRAVFVGEIEYVNGDYVEVASGVNVIPFDLTAQGVTVVPADQPDRFERALTVLAGMAADMDATAKRCESGGRPSAAIERRVEDAVRMALIAAIEVDGVETDAAIVRAHALIAEAVKRRG